MPLLIENQDSQGIVLTDKELRITFWNQWMEMHSGYSNASVLGRNLLDVFPNFSENQIYQEYKKALDGEAVTLSQQVNNSLFPLHTDVGINGSKMMQQSARIVPIQSGNIIQGTITLIEDVTDRVWRERELERQVAELEALQEVTEALISNPLEKCLQMIADKASQLLNIPNVAFVICDDIKWEIIATSSSCGLTNEFSFYDEYTIVDKVVAAKEYLICSDITESINYYAVKTLFQSTQSFIAVPFSTENEVAGVLIVESPEKDAIPPFCKSLLTRFAGLAASAIWNVRLQRERREKEQHLRIALESAEIGEWSLDIDSSVMNVSTVCKAILGLSTDSTGITAREFLQIVHREDHAKVQEAFAKAVEELQDLNLDFKVVWNDGSIHWITTSGRCLYDEAGNQTRLVGVMRDYTYRKHREDRLSTKEKQLQIALETANLGMWQKDVQTGEINGSPIFKAIFDYPPDKLITMQDIHNRTHPEDVERMSKLRSEAFDKKVNFHAEYRISLDDESVRWISTSAHCIRDEDGEAVQYIGVSQDITERKKIENDLKRLALVAQKTQNAVHITDHEDKFVWVNEGFTKMFGYTLDEAIGKKPEELLRGPLSSTKTGEEITNSCNQRLHSSFEIFNYAKDGRGFWINLSVTPLVREDNSLEGFVGIISDLTERKQIEVELAQARDAALESAKLKSQFLANMSHEIRTPMNGIIGMTELLLETELDEEQRDCADIVRISADTLLKLLNDILDFSKIEAGKLDIEKVDINLQEVIDEVVRIFSEKARQRGIALASIIEQDVPWYLKGDRHRLKQVLTNLISNSLKFTDKGYILLRVKTEKNQQDKIRLRFSITDTGIGISDEVKARIFQPFTQADGSMTRKYGGTGLGLSICTQLIELMGGEIGVESQLGTGSTFWFTIDFENRDSDSPKEDLPLKQLKGKKVLILGDRDNHQYLLTQQLEASGILCCVAENETDATDNAANEHFDYDLLICTSPKSADGFRKFLSETRSNNKLQNLPVLLCASTEEIKQLENSAVSNNCRILSLPIRQSELLASLAEADTDCENIKTSSERDSIPEIKTKLEKKMKVLIVEDAPTNQQVAGLMLKRLGCDVDISDNGHTALSAIENNNYDIVFMDCQMPVMDGYEATKELRNREGMQRRSTVIAMTAHAMMGDKEKCLEAGMDDYISKPIKQQDLMDVIEKWGKKNNLHQEVSVTSIQLTEDISTAQRTVDLSSSFAMEIFERLDDLSFALDPEDIIEIIDQLIEVAPVQLEGLMGAISSKDSQQIRGIAHSLKGSISNMGSNHLANYLADIEHKGRDNNLYGLEEIFSHLKEEWQDMVTVLLAYKAKLSQ